MHLRLRWPKQCRCGAQCPPGTEVVMLQDETGGWNAIACPVCSDELARGQVDMASQQRTTSLAEACRNRAARRRRKVERERGEG